MPRYEDFGSNVEAHLRYAGHRPLSEAWEILRRRLDDGSWKEAPQAWLRRLQHRRQEAGVESMPAKELHAALIEQVLRLDLASSERVVHEVLPALFFGWFKPMLVPADVDRLVAWFLKQARPGHASLAADVVSAAYNLEHVPSADFALSQRSVLFDREARRLPVGLAAAREQHPRPAARVPVPPPASEIAVDRRPEILFGARSTRRG